MLHKKKEKKKIWIILQQEIWKLSWFNNVKEKLDTVTQRPRVYIDLRKKNHPFFPPSCNCRHTDSPGIKPTALSSPPSLPHLGLCLMHSQGSTTASSLLHDFIYKIRLIGHICQPAVSAMWDHWAGEEPQHHIQTRIPSRSIPHHSTSLRPLLCPCIDCDGYVSWHIIHYLIAPR